MTKSIPTLNEWMQGQKILAIACAFLSIIPLLMIMCCIKMARKVPTNYLLLSALTGLETFMLMYLTSTYRGTSVVVAAGMTLGITIALTIYAFYTETDFTVWSNAILIVSLVSLMMCIAWIFVPANSWWHHLIAGVFVLVYTFYIIWHTQLIVGGRGEELKLDDYVIGATLLYLDIIYSSLMS